MKYLVALSFVLSSPAWSFVSSSTPATSDSYEFSYKYTQEGGSVEPNESRSSFQDADIDIHSIGVLKGFGNSEYWMDRYLSFEFNSFTSAEEAINGTVYYEEDKGHFLKVEVGANLVHEANVSFGLFLGATTVKDLNEDRFSNPRVDDFFAGTNYGINATDILFFAGQLYYGSGISDKQNPAVALSQFVGLRLDRWLSRFATIQYGPYVELDLKNRFDPKYDADFSDPGEQDRIRAMKVATALIGKFEVLPRTQLEIGFVNKLGGYDARATKSSHVKLNYSF